MRIHYSFDTAVDIKNPVVTTGTFDGVHVGHQVIIRRLNKLARDLGGESILITFHPHPRRVLYPETEGKDLMLICSQEEKIILLQETGLDHLIILEFTREFAKVTSREFVEDYLVSRLHARMVIVGFNHHFGYNREGDFSYLYQLGRQHGFDVEEIPEQDIHNEFVSSTKIRSALWEGNIQRANAYLDHYYFIQGESYAESDPTEFYGHPIFKLKIKEKIKLIPPDGVYAVNIAYSEYKYKGLLSIVNRQKIHDGLNHGISLDFCFMDPSHNITGGEVKVFLHKKIRNALLNGNVLQLKTLFKKDLREIDELIY